MSAWDRCRAWLLPAMHDTSEAETLAEIITGRAQLWVGETAAMVTRVEDTADGRCLHVWHGGGLLGGLLALRPGVEAYGRAWGCNIVTINGRSGWGRALKPFGFEPTEDGQLRKAL